MLLRFSKSPAVAAVVPRWEEGIRRTSSIVCKDWSMERKSQVVLRKVLPILPMIFSGCETVHISLSTFRTIRAKLNTAVLGRWTCSSHLLSPLFATQTVYEPFLYVCKTRLASLRMSALSFGDCQVLETWNWVRRINLLQSQHKIYGPVALFLWCCQVLKWTVRDNFVVEVAPQVTLHLLLTPKKTWNVLLIRPGLTMFSNILPLSRALSLMKLRCRFGLGNLFCAGISSYPRCL